MMKHRWKKKISLKEALCGIAYKITHLDGHTIDINTANVITSNATIYVIKGEGIANLGDLHISYEIEFPDHLPQSTRNILENLL